MPTVVNTEIDLVADDLATAAFIQQAEQAPSEEALQQLLPAAEQATEGVVHPASETAISEGRVGGLLSKWGVWGERMP